MRTVSRIFYENAEAHPDDPFCTFTAGPHRETISYGELYERSARYASAFVETGCNPGDLVIVMHEHSPHLFYAFLGVLLAGCVPSFMPFPSPKQKPQLFWQEHRTLFARIKPRLLASSQTILAQADNAIALDIPTLVMGEAQLDHPVASQVPGLRAAASDVACLQHSSGTTGLKKAVRLTHAAIVGQIEAYARSIGLSPDDRIASWLPLYHDMGFIACFMTAVVTRCPLVALDPFEWSMRPRILLDAIERERATLCWLPNFAFMHIANATRSGQWDLRSMRAFINCSEPCKPAAFDRFLERFADSGVTADRLQICYAMAENVFAVTQTRLGKPVKRSSRPDGGAALSCGAPIDGVAVRICEPSSNVELSDGSSGEIQIGGAYLFDGYDKLPEKTAERLRDGWYRSGDVGFIADGEVYVLGRLDDMLIVAGRNFYAHEIEEIACGVEHVIPGRTVAVGVEGEGTGTLAVVVLAECDDALTDNSPARAIAGAIFDRLSLAVHSVVLLRPGELVKTTSGKISRKHNHELYLQGRFEARSTAP